MAGGYTRTGDFDKDLVKDVEDRRMASEHAFQTLVTNNLKRIEGELTIFSKKGKFWHIAQITAESCDVQECVAKRLIELYREKGYKVYCYPNNNFKISWSKNDAEKDDAEK